MRKSYSNYFVLILIACSVFVASCKKDPQQPETPVISNFATLGLYQQSHEINGITYKRLFMPVKVGTSNTLYATIFDTGSAGLTIDARGLIPANMITSNGIIFAGDSTLENGITITSTQGVISFGGGSSGETHEYGHIAYAKVIMGNGSETATATRVPIFLYYKVEDGNGQPISTPHSVDVFGVGPGESYVSKKIASPLSYFKLPAGVTNGFKLALLTSPFALYPLPANYVSSVLTIGLTPTDLNSSGFIMHTLNHSSVSGYLPIPATVTYGTTTVNNAALLFDTGNPAITYLADPFVSPSIVHLPAGTNVSLTTNKGFSYQYTTTANSTDVINSNVYGDPRSIFSIDFFVKNQYLLDYQNHRIGLKNN